MKLATILAAALVAVVLTATTALGAKTGGLPVIDVTTDGSSISVDGGLVSGAVDVHVVATGQSGAPLFVRLKDGVTADQFLAFLGTNKAHDPNNVADYGAIVFDAGVGPGTHDVDTILQPGDYVALDTAANNPADWPHTTFTIADNSSPMSLPAAQQWQKSVEFKFRGPGTLHAGQTIRVSNVGWVVHMMGGFQVKSPAEGHQAIKYLRAGNNNAVGKIIGANGGNFVDLFGPVSHGAVQQFVLDVKPGWYVIACFMDTQDGREHTRLGMERLIHIVK